MLVGDLIYSEAYSRKSRGCGPSVIGDVVSAEQQIHQTDPQIIRWCSCSFFNNIWTYSQEARRFGRVVLWW